MTNIRGDRTFQLSWQKSGWHWLGLLLLVGLSFGLRLWGLGRFPVWVFDEVYYPPFALQFLQGEASVSGHPPLGTYLISLALWLAHQLPHTPDLAALTADGLSQFPMSYRWLNAIAGGGVPIAIALVMYRLTQQWRAAGLAGLFAAVDGLLIVESRYGLINLYIVGFGVLGYVCLLDDGRWRSLWRIVAGICFGAAIAVKWNGAGFLLGLYGYWLLARWAGWTTVSPHLTAIARLSLRQLLVYGGVIPLMTYWVAWQPMLAVTGDRTLSAFWTVHNHLLNYHDAIGGFDAHPYCSAWYTWPWMWRPIAYFYSTGHTPTAPPTLIGPPLPADAVQVVYSVQAMGNPILWWLATAAIAVLVIPWLRAGLTPTLGRCRTVQLPMPDRAIAGFLVVNGLANWLPWIVVQRCTFLYHGMAALVFAIMAIAWLCDRWLAHPRWWPFGAIAVASILGAFLFWLPVYLGLPLSPDAWALRFWLPSWI